MNPFNTNSLVEEVIKYASGAWAGQEVNVGQKPSKAPVAQQAAGENEEVSQAANLQNPPLVDLADRKSVEALVDDENVFPQELVAKIKDLVIDSILRRGLDLARNPFLRFLMYKDKLRKSGIQIPQAQGKIIAQACENKEFKTFGSENLEDSFLNKWWAEPKAYKGDPYKIQALILLTDSEKAKKFGDLDARPLAEILDATSKKEVEDILTRWSAASGEKQERGSSFKRSPAAKGKVSDQDAWLKEVEDHYKAVGLTNTKKILDAAKKVWKKGKNAAQAWADLRTALTPATSSPDTAANTKTDSGTAA